MKAKFSKLNKILKWTATIGILPVAVSYFWLAITADVNLTFIGKADRGYEFQLSNKSSLEKTIKTFRVNPDFSQKVIFKVTSDNFGAIQTENGIELVGGNETHIPAFEYRELDNYFLKAKSDITFRIPPLIAKDGLQVEAMIVFINYEVQMLKTISNLEFG